MIITNIKKLRKKSKALSLSQYKALQVFEKLEKELIESKSSGLGLAAIQIGLPYRAAIIRMPKLDINLYNPKVIKMENPIVFVGEACLSIPGKVYKTNRYNKITVENGDGQIIKASGIYAIVLQHEISHFDGKLITDYMIKEPK